MPRSLLTRLLAGSLVAGLALGGLAACGDSDDGGSAEAPESSVGDLLDLVPDTPANRAYVLVQRYDAAEDGAAAWDAEGSDEDQELTRLAQLGTQTGISPLALMGGTRVAELAGALGFAPSDVRAGIRAGLPPEVTEVALVDVDEDAVLDTTEAAVDGATREEVDGVDVVRWLDDGRIEPKLATPVGDLEGQAGRVAWTAPGALALATTDDVIADAIGVGGDDDGSLGDDEAFDDVAEALDDADVYGATLTGVPIEATPGPRATPAQVEAAGGGGGALEPYAALGVGGAWTDDGLQLVIVLAHADEAGAEANAAALTAGVADGTRALDGQAWSDVLTDADITQDGTVVVGRFTVEDPRLWTQLIEVREPLLAVG